MVNSPLVSLILLHRSKVIVTELYLLSYPRMGSWVNKVTFEETFPVPLLQSKIDFLETIEFQNNVFGPDHYQIHMHQNN
jgi:hypothetical protein